MPKDEPSSQSNRDSDLKIHQLQQYLHRPGQIYAAPRPSGKQMALSQLTSPQSGHPLRDLIKLLKLTLGRFVRDLGLDNNK